MGDEDVLELVKVVSGRLNSASIQAFGPLWGFKYLMQDFNKIEVVVHDAEEKRRRVPAVDSWLKSLRSACLMVENVLDEISTQAMLQRLEKERGIKYNKVRGFFSSDVLFRVRVAQKVSGIRRKLHAIASKIYGLNLTRLDAIGQVDVDVAGKMPGWETSSIIHHFSVIFGRYEEVKMVIETICNKDIIGKQENGEIRVYAIWGMGGVGKTTLAQSVYNHERVYQYFDLKCWVYVSENFQVKEIMKQIIETIDRSECTLTHIDALQKSLQNKLRGKKFLIVLDDVLIDYGEEAKWDLLSKKLSCGSERSIVVMTTRSVVTSQMMAKVPKLQHKLGCLSGKDAWLLFEKFAFVGRDMDNKSELEPIGRMIVKKCKGVPLVVKTLACLMSSKRSREEWQHVKDSIILELQETSVLSVLKLSYDNLLPHLKKCFAYCCLFPKGYELEKKVLIQLWLSNGFIPPKGDSDLYQLGEEIFNSLSLRSFFQKYSNDKYKMHDLMHDMAQQAMGDDCLSIEHADKEVIIPNEVLHLSSSHPDFQFSPGDLQKLASLRSLFMFGEGYECSIRQILNHHVYLRVLYLCGIRLSALPESICKLKYLKYLNLSHSSIEVLPESIVYLQNLQVLLLSFCYELRELPKGLRYMSSLRLLDISYCHALRCLPSGIKQQTRLFIRGLRNLSCTKLGELGDLDCVEISRLEDVREDEAKSANLKDKSNLLVLKLSWSNIYMRKGKVDMFTDEKVLEGLEPNPCLKELSIYFYMGMVISPNWMEKLNNLVEIGFSGCKLCEVIPPLGKLAKLRVIKLFGMDSLEGFNNNDMSTEQDTNMFPCLQELNISMCPNLLSLPHYLPQLEILKLQECGALSSLPSKIQSFTRMKELEITGCNHLSERCKKDEGVDWLKVSHIPNIRIDSPSYFEDEDEDKDKDEIDDESWLVKGVLSHGGYGTYEVHGTLKHKVTLAGKIPPHAIDVYWTKHDFSPSFVEQEEVDLDKERGLLRRKRMSQANVVKKSLVSKPQAVEYPRGTMKKEPVVQEDTLGCSTLKKQQQKKDDNAGAPSQLSRVDPPRHSSYVPSQDTRRPSSTSKSEKPAFQHSQSTSSKVTSTRDDHGFPLIVKDEDVSNITRFSCWIPPLFHQHISQIQDVKPDGNCGFRSVAIALGYEEKEWLFIRQHLLQELDTNEDLWKGVFDNVAQGEYDLLRHTINWMQDEAAPNQHWMSMPYTGLVIAQTFGSIVHLLTNSGSQTFFPLWHGPGPHPNHRVGSLVFVDNNHFIMVRLDGEYPIPVTNNLWNMHRNDEAAGWERMYRHRIIAFQQVTANNNNTTSQYIYDN